MKWVFLINNASSLIKLFAKLSYQIIEQEDECFVVVNSKIAEYEKKKFFPKQAKFVSKVDWCIKNYQENKEEFGDLSWRELFPTFDRFKPVDFSYHNSFKIVSQLYQFFDFIFKEEKPDLVISESPAGLFHEVAYYFCKKNNIVYFGLDDAKFNNRINLYDLKSGYSEYEKTFVQLNDYNISEKEKEFGKKFTEIFISHKSLPRPGDLKGIYFTQFGIVKHYIKRIKENGSFLFRYLRKRKYFKDFDYESETVLKYALLASLKMERRQFRILFQKNIFSKLGKEDDKFFFYPLHYQPESSTSVYANYYCDQLNTIKNIAFTLPFPYKLYVKEHPASVGTRPKSFYKKLKEIPNLVLISPYENVENIVKKSSGVVVLTGTIGMEAAFVGKPVYVLGDVFYSYHPFCRKLRNFEELKDEIERDLANKPNTDDLESINCRFIISYFRNTIKGDIASARMEKDTNNYKLIYHELRRIFENLSNLQTRERV